MIYTDQTGFEVEVISTSRIISLVPSQTEFLVDIGLKDVLVGVTKFCIHPKGLVREIGHVGGTKNLNLDRIKELKPDLIIGNKEENTKSEIEELRKHFPVWMSDIVTVDDGIDMMASLGEILGKTDRVNKLIQSIQSEREKFSVSQSNQPSALYFIWKNPDMVVGSLSFIDDMVSEAGFVNVGRTLGERYPILDGNTEKPSPDYVLLSTEPYPFKKRDISDFQLKFPDSKVFLVDGEMFSWYGSRMKKAFKYFDELRKNERS